MVTITLTDLQVKCIKNLLMQEIDYLEQDGINYAEIESDKKELKKELKACKDLYEKLTKK